MKELWAQIGELISERGHNNTERIRDLLNQLAPLQGLKKRLEREAVQREREALTPVFVDGFGDGDGFGHGFGVDSASYNGTRNPILLRYFFVCLGGWTTVVGDKLVFDRCMKMHSSEGLRQLNQSRALTHGQSCYCECGVGFKASSGVIVEIRENEKYWYMRALCPDADILDMLAMAHETNLGEVNFDQLHARPRMYSKCLVTHQAGGLARFESHEIFLKLRMFEWESIFQFAAFLERTALLLAYPVGVI
jgi:hypothetical protein